MAPTDTFFQWNVQGMSSSKEDLINIVDNFKPSVIAIQETFYGNDFVSNIKGYNALCKQGHYNQRFHGGVALYIHNSVPFNKIDIQSETQIIAAQVSLSAHKMVTIASVYIPPRANEDFEDLLACITALPKPFVIMGDFNAHHIDWGNRTNDRRGRLLQEFCQNNNINIINDGSATHISGTSIDLTLVSPEITPNIEFTTSASVLSSDHYPVMLTVALQQTTNQRSEEVEHEKWNFKKGDWKGYKADPSWEMIHEKELPSDPTEAIEELYQQFQEMANKYIPKQKTRRFYAKPWWSPECKAAWLEREKLYRKFKQTGQVVDQIAWKRARAIARTTFREAKQQSWRAYVSTLNTTTPSSEIWKTINKIRGYSSRKINILKVGNEYVSSIEDITEKLAETFENISSDKNYSPEFLKHKEREEKNAIDFRTDNSEPYNAPFTFQELTSAINSNRVTAPGPDEISNLMLKNLPENAQKYLLNVYNKLWINEAVYQPWKKAIIIPIAKPGKDHSNPTNYRPISLTSCVCKTYEKMINRRLTEYLENNKKFAAIQCGFRKYRATIDHLIRFDTYIRKAIADKKHVMAVFFDCEKAYDMAWRHGILKDLFDAGVKGRLARFIQEFLKDRCFQVKLDEQMSTTKLLETGTPQGSTLSVTLFAIKINSLAKEIPEEVFSSLFVDDLLIAYADHDLKKVQNTLQRTIDKVSTWARRNGSRFSQTKTNTMHFYQGTEPVITPDLYMEGTLIPSTESTKFLGLHWDRKLNWTNHINSIKKRCANDLNLMRTLSSYTWGADREILMRLYRTLIRPKIDYGCLVYGSASTTLLKSLDVIHNEAMRISTGAVKTTPIQNLSIICNEPCLDLRRQDLLLRHYFKMKCHLLNPAYSCMINDRLELYFNSRQYGSTPVIQRVRQAINRFDVPLRPVFPYFTPKLFSWTLKRPSIEHNLSELKKNELPPHILKLIHKDHMSQYQGYAVIYTDGSKSEDGVGAAAVMGTTVRQMSLPATATVMTSELYAIQLALGIIRDTSHDKYVICTDSLSSIQAIDHHTEKNLLLQKIMILINEIIMEGRDITLSWVPSHVGIKENERADCAAKEAAKKPAEFVFIPYRDWYPLIKKRVYDLWEEEWNLQRRDLQSIKSRPGKWNEKRMPSRQEEICLNRLRLEHTAITHGYLTNPDDLGQRPICGWCEDAIITVKHILMECPALEEKRRNILKPEVKGEMTMKNILGEKGPLKTVIIFLKEINIFKYL